MLIPPESDGALVVLARAGDRQAFGTLYERHRRFVSGIVHNYGIYEQAEDLIHDAFIKAMEGLPKAREDTDFPNWLARITVNVCLDHLRRSSTKLERPGGLPSDNSEDGGLSYALYKQGVTDPDELPEEHVLRRERVRLMDELLQTLPEQDAVAIRMKADGAEVNEIARRLITPRHALKSRMFRVRATLAHTVLTSPERYDPLDTERAVRSMKAKLSAYNPKRRLPDAPALPEESSP